MAHTQLIYVCSLTEVRARVAPQVKLYAEFDPSRLLSFLMASQSYPLEPALRVCQEQGLIREQVARSSPSIHPHSVRHAVPEQGFVQSALRAAVSARAD